MDVLLAAPFVKRDTIARLLGLVPPDVPVRCVTRWRPEEVVAGVSDLGIWPLISDRPGTSLWLRPDLHAKYYRIDGECFVGSANLTATALGWRSNPNFELLVCLPAEHLELMGFEASLAAGCVQVNDDLFAAVSKAVETLLTLVPPKLAAASEPDPLIGHRADESQVSTQAWLPQLRNPSDLFLAYSGGASLLGFQAQPAARADLAALSVPQGLPRDAFEACIAGLLLQMPLVRAVDEFVATPQRFGAVRAFLARLPCGTTVGFDATSSWQTLMRWMMHFLPARYEHTVPRHTEVFRRIVPPRSP